MTRISKEALKAKKETQRAIQYPRAAATEVVVEEPKKKAKAKKKVTKKKVTKKKAKKSKKK